MLYSLLAIPNSVRVIMCVKINYNRHTGMYTHCESNRNPAPFPLLLHSLSHVDPPIKPYYFRALQHR